MKEFPNLAIMASAGTGKTYSLAMRYITLLKLGVKPEEIVAMTFTNKAAGEIFDKIIQEILKMIASPAQLRSVIDAGSLPENTTREELFTILRKILCAPKKLQISTLDSFFFNIINAFPFECGIAGEITMLPENDDEQRVDALLRLIRSSSDKQRKILLELLKLSSLNTEPYSIFAPTRELIQKSYGEYLKYPEEELWHNTALLDPETDDSDLLTDDDLLHFQNFFKTKAEAYGKGDAAQYYKKLADLAEMAGQYAKMPVDLKDKFKNPISTFLENDPDWLNASSVETKYRKTIITLEGKELEIVQKIIRHLLSVEFRNITNRTLANYNLLRKFDETYAEMVRRNGNLTFKDIPFLLKPDDNAGALALPFSSSAVLEERLDARYNHYLLDEFQDTSDEQWRAISNLVDEIFQPDQDRFRSFFYVGDIKQSIYQWRDGNPELFEAVFRRYSNPGFDTSRLRKATLTCSYRSSIPVIETVNRVFLHPENIPGTRIADAIRKMEFEEHSSAPSAARQPGYAALIECRENEKEVSPESVFELLLSLDPFSDRHDYSVGILTLGNEFAADMAERFRALCKERNLESAFSITLEGVMLLNDSMLFAVYRNLLTLALHPGDPMARGFLSMIELPEDHLTLRDLPLLHGDKEKEPDPEAWFRKLSRHIRTSSAANGFTQYARRFCRIFQSRLADFDAKRLDLTLDAAMKFDASGNKNIADYIHYLDCIESKSSSIRKTVQFMSIHKSKGLDFDSVILPDLHTQNGIDTYVNRGELFVKKDAEFHPRWVTYPPKTVLTPYFREIAALKEQKTNAYTYEKCCLLYVAMTRARHALYLMTAAEKNNDSDTIRFADILKSTLAPSPVPVPAADEAWISRINENLRSAGENAPQLAILYSCGDVWWADRKTVRNDQQTALLRKSNRNFRILLNNYFSAPREVIPEKRNLLRKPSDSETKAKKIRPASAGTSGGTELGLHLHALFQRIGFLDETNTERILLDYLEEIGENTAPELQETITSIFRQAVSTTDAAELLSRPPGTTAELWRERKFCIRIGGILTSCVFDRVMIERDASGNVERVTLIDYKSDNSDDPAYFREAYSSQLDQYAEILHTIFHCGIQKVLFLLRSGKKLIL